MKCVLRDVIAIVAAFAVVTSALTVSGAEARSSQCDQHGVRELVHLFAGAYSRGEATKVDQMFASNPDFITYTDLRAIGGAIPYTIQPVGRSALREYVQFRRLFHESIDVDRMWDIKRVRWGWAFGVVINKESLDNPIGGKQIGKGGVSLDCKKLLFWNIGV